MSDDASDWRSEARNVYRASKLRLLSLSHAPATVEEQFYVDELEEALLDLKESVLNGDEPRGQRHLAEVQVIIGELQRLGL